MSVSYVLLSERKVRVLPDRLSHCNRVHFDCCDMSEGNGSHFGVVVALILDFLESKSMAVPRAHLHRHGAVWRASELRGEAAAAELDRQPRLPALRRAAEVLPPLCALRQRKNALPTRSSCSAAADATASAPMVRRK